MTDIIEHDDVDTMRVMVPGFGIAAHTLRDLLTGALVAAGKDDTLPVLATVRLEWTGDELRAVSTDRYRLMVARVVRKDEYSQRDGSMFAPNGDGDALVSRNDVADLVKVLPKLAARSPRPELVRVSVIADSLLVEGDGWSRTLRLAAGEFPKYRSLIPGEELFKPVDNVTYNPKFLADIGKIPVDKGTPVRLRFTEQNRPMVATLDGANGVEDYMYMLMPVRTAG